MSNATLPILYSFRRCPYAMRARMALTVANIELEHREVQLKDKPAQMLALSPKGTVPVLLLTNGTVLEESLDIMHWALQQEDPFDWLAGQSESQQQIIDFDKRFKPDLDAYKYSARMPTREQESARLAARDRCEQILHALDQQLQAGDYLYSTSPSIADVALLPFVRQFANVERNWFDSLSLPHLQAWLNGWLAGELFKQIMTKHPQWVPLQA